MSNIARLFVWDQIRSLLEFCVLNLFFVRIYFSVFFSFFLSLNRGRGLFLFIYFFFCSLFPLIVVYVLKCLFFFLDGARKADISKQQHKQDERKETGKGKVPCKGEYRNVGCTCVYILEFTCVIQVVYMCNTRALDAYIKLMLKQVKKIQQNIGSRPTLW